MTRGRFRFPWPHGGRAMTEECVTDCSGCRVPVGDKLYSTRCWVGNTDDFLKDNAHHLIPGWEDWGAPASVFFFMPIFRSGSGFIPSVVSLLQQSWPKDATVELLLYVNEPCEVSDPLTAESFELAQALERGESPPGIDPTLLANSVIQFRALREKLSGGLAHVYRRSFSTLVARMRRAADELGLESKDDRADAIGKMMAETVFGVIDDDIIFCDTTTFPDTVGQLPRSKAVLLGDETITEVFNTNPHLNRVLAAVMNQFLRFKYDLGTAVLPPRAAAVVELFHLPGVDIGTPYADQIWFATALLDNDRLYVPVETNIEDEQYPSNAAMTARLATFLETGNDRGALEIFENLRPPYSTGSGTRFCVADVELVLSVLERRDIPRIEAVLAGLNAR